MAHVKIILTEDVEALGRVGQVVSVKAGFGRNYLIPQGKALPATPGNLAMVSARRQVYEAAALKARTEAAELANRINNLQLSIARKVGEAETLYGSVTTSDVGRALEGEGVVLDRRRILLTEPIKTLGVYQVPIRLHPDVTAELKLWVVEEQ